jgi:hypothetical protein
MYLNLCQGKNRRKFTGIINQFSLSCASHKVSKLAALTQPLITLGSPELSEQPEQSLSSIHLTNKARCWVRAQIMSFLSIFNQYSEQPKEAPKDSCYVEATSRLRERLAKRE